MKQKEVQESFVVEILDQEEGQKEAGQRMEIYRKIYGGRSEKAEREHGNE